jgi:ribosomal protein S12 methylthiotransferase accessory factor
MMEPVARGACRGVDVVSTLNPVSGLVGGWCSLPPQPPQEPMWRVMVDLGGAPVPRSGPEGYPFALVGAYGFVRAEALVRGAGEAVERAALRPTEAQLRAGSLLAGDAPGLTGWITTSPAGLTTPTAFGEPMTWYPGRRLDDDRPVLVPAPLVDWWGGAEPAGIAPPRFFDPSPSGAASGASPEQAARSALLEIIERDAVLTAWAVRLAAVRVDPQAVLDAAPPSVHRSALRNLLAAAQHTGVRPVFGRLPTGVPGVECVVCAIAEHGTDRSFGAVGAKASEDLVRNLLGSLQESLQIRALLTTLQQDLPRPAAATVVANDVDRAWLWTTPRAVEALEAWTERFRDRPWHPHEVRPLSLGEIVAAVRADGGEPVVVQLTGRLPPAIVSAGWSAVKVVCPGYQALRMDERLDFTWCSDRVAATAARTGLGAGVPDDIPHPLI